MEVLGVTSPAIQKSIEPKSATTILFSSSVVTRLVACL